MDGFEGFAGELLRPGDAGYDDARRVHNGLVDKRPALIARCRGTADIAAAIAHARASGLEISVRGGGHNVGGRAVTDGGVMVDLSLMKAIAVDPDARTVRAEGGVTWGEFNEATHAHGLATTGGVISTTGIAGLTLGGGLGWLLPKFGLAADNLLSVEVVTADGETINASEDEHPDLFWGLRGGGGNFGVAASLTYRLHALTEITGGLVAHPFEAAGEVLRFLRGFAADASDDLMIFGGLLHAPDGSGVPLAAIAVCHAGPPDQAQIDLKPLLDFGSPVMAQVGPMPYPDMNRMLDDAYPRGALNYWKSTFVTDLDDGLIDTVVERFAACPSAMSAALFENFHGAACRVGVTDTAVANRDPGFNFLITSEWTDPAATDENISWTRETYEAIAPYSAGRRWLNYLDADDLDDAVRAAFGPNHERLRQVKRAYDPENVFRLNQNVQPA